MLNATLIAAAALLLAALLALEYTGHPGLILAAKAPLSCLFILAAAMAPHPHAGYFHLLLGGLICCLGGDVFLALRQPRAFSWGLAAFLAGHVFYLAAFIRLAGMNAWAWAGLLPAAAFSTGVFLWLRPHLGRMGLPVFCYVVVITLMVAGAFAVFGEPRIAAAGRRLVPAGALCFYVSDLFVARERFVRSGFLNRLLGLPLYYGGQFLLAFSVGQV
jgi:uncharacterized membrane protein YhhN